MQKAQTQKRLIIPGGTLVSKKRDVEETILMKQTLVPEPLCNEY